MGVVTEQKVQWVKHHNESMFSFALDRPPSLRFKSGEFIMVGLKGDNGKLILRAYSIASPHYAEELQFLSIKVADGPLTSKLQLIQPGDSVFLGLKPTGTLILDALLPGQRLHLLGTGTGLAPWLSIIQDPEAYDRYERVVLDHTVRRKEDLVYSDFLHVEITTNELVGPAALEKLFYTPAVTREEEPPLGGALGRVTDRIRSGQYEKWHGITLDPAIDRFMICGSIEMTKELASMLDERGFKEGSVNVPGDYVIERAFVG